MSYQTCWICRKDTNCENRDGRNICKMCDICQSDYLDFEDSDDFNTREIGKRMRNNVADSQVPPEIDR